MCVLHNTHILLCKKPQSYVQGAPGIYTIQDIYPQKNLMNVHYSIFHNSQKVETTQIPFS